MNFLLHDYGGYSFSLQLAEYLTRAGHEITYVHGGTTQAVKRFSTTAVHALNGKLRIKEIALSKPFAKYSFVQRWIQEREYSQLLSKLIIEEKPDVIISANAPLDVQQKALKISRKLKIPFIYWWQDVISFAMWYLLTERYWVFGNLISAYYLIMERNLLNRSSKVIAISEDFLSIALTWGISEKKIAVLPNWAPLEQIPILPKDNPWARSRDLENKFVFLYTGILGLKHDPKIFVILAGHFRDQKDVVVVVVSDGPGVEWLQEQKQVLSLDNLQIHPFQPYEDYPQILATSDVLLAVLKKDAGNYSVPSKILSYFCAERPVLISAPYENSISKLVMESGLGLVANSDDHDKLCDLACKLYESRELRSKYGKTARAYAQRAFIIEDIAERFLKLL